MSVHQHYPGCSLYLNRWLAWCPITGKTAVVPANKREKGAKEGAIVGMVDKMDSRTGSDRSASLLSRGVGQPSSLYIAGLFDDRDRLRPMRDALVGMGYVVTSTWLNEPDDKKGDVKDNTFEYYKLCGVRDIAEITASDGIVIDTLSVTPRGGREWEGGYAQGLGLAVWLVGPVRNVFHTLHPRFESWEECLAYFKERSYGGRP